VGAAGKPSWQVSYDARVGGKEEEVRVEGGKRGAASLQRIRTSLLLLQLREALDLDGYHLNGGHRIIVSRPDLRDLHTDIRVALGDHAEDGVLRRAW